MAFQVRLSDDAKRQLANLPAFDRRRVADAIEKNLLHEPFAATMHRKELRENELAPWELRVGHLRVFYRADPDDPLTVRVLALGDKRGNKVFIDGREYKL